MSAIEQTALTAVLRRDRMIVAAALAVLIVLAWAYTLSLAASMSMPVEKPGAMAMSGHGMVMTPSMKPWTAVEFVLTFTMWTVMMVGMMTPSAAPMILLYARVGRQAELQGKPLAATGFFAAGYLSAWVGFSLIATFGQWLLEHAGLLTPAMAAANEIAGALVLITAGLFQWTPLKDACLTRCQSPLLFIQQHGGFRADRSGALSVGLQHGLYCVGCCWALMTLLFVGGVMNILWIAALAVFVLAEKLIPAGRIVSRSAGAILLVWGTWLLASAIG